MNTHIRKHDTAAPAPTKSTPPLRKRAARDYKLEFLGFTSNGDLYGFPLENVREILRVGSITDVPRSAEFVVGILSVRGRITTVIDLGRRLGFSERQTDSRNQRILLVDSGHEVWGVQVDAVLQVFRFREDQLEAPTVVSDNLSEYVLGLGRTDSADIRSEPSSDTTRDIASQSSRTETTGEAVEGEIVILLDPVSLLKRGA